MKIAMLLPGGVDRSGTHRVIPFVLWLMERVAREHDLHVFAFRQEPRPSRYELLGAQVHNIGARPRPFRALVAMVREHRRAPFDVLHALWAVPSGVVAAVAGQLLRRPVLLHLIGDDLEAMPEIDYGLRSHARRRLWLRTAVAGATEIFVSSTVMQEHAAALGIETARVPYGVALDRWPSTPPRRRDPGRAARLIHVGSLNRVKDHPVLLEALRVLVAQGVDCHLDVVGEDTLDGRIQRMAESLGLGAHVTFHGFLPHSELRPLMERAHLLLLTSRHESGPLVVLEAAIAGVPTVGTAVGHLIDWAPDAAVTVPVGDFQALARATSTVLADEERRLRLAGAAQARAGVEDADWTAKQTLEKYEILAGGPLRST